MMIAAAGMMIDVMTIGNRPSDEIDRTVVLMLLLFSRDDRGYDDRGRDRGYDDREPRRDDVLTHKR